MSRRAPARLAAACALLLAGGCINPFDPRSDVELAQFTPTEIDISGTVASSATFSVIADFVVKNKVGVQLSSVDIVYTDLNGNPAAYRSTGGRHFRIAVRLDPVTTNGSVTYGEGVSSPVILTLADRTVIEELQSPAYPPDGYMFADVTFRGVDDNGHDVKLSGRMTIKIYK